MPNGSVDITLRPLKLALLVNPNDKSSLLEAIQLNSFLWGGTYNPIIPVYKKTPINWDNNSDVKGYKNIVNGYIDTFDPDFIVKIGNLDDINYLEGSRKIITLQDIYTNNINRPLLPKYGLGIVEVLNQFIRDDFEFVRKYPYNLVTFNFNDKYSLFLKSVFGCLKDDLQKYFLENYEEYFPFDTIECRIDSFGEYFKQNYQFFRRISEQYIKHVRTRNAWRSDCVLILDAKSNLDIIDYWNLRAIGWRILPFPIQSIKDDKLIKHIMGFIDYNHYPMQSNTEIYNDTNILKGRAVKNEDYKNTLEYIRSNKTETTNRRKYFTQTWYPRMWDNWAREHDNVEYCLIESKSKSIELPNNDDKVVFDNLKPKFAKGYWREGPQFANEIELNIYGDEKILFSKVIPEASNKLIYAFRTHGFDEWRFSRNGMIFLSKHNEEKIDIRLPKSQDVFIGWLEDKNYKPIVSDNGLKVNQIVKYFGGTWDLTYLAKEPIIRLLIELREGKTKSEKEMLQILSKLFENDKGNKQRQSIIESLCKLNVIQSGFEIKCPICFQPSWYSLRDLDYKLNCPKCINEFKIYFSTQNNLKLSFKTVGPFNFTKNSYGILSELLTLRFFTNIMHNPTTILTAFNLTKEIEIDLGIIFQSSYMGDKKIKILFAECKTFNEFRILDIKRMKSVAMKFPGCILIFATLNSKLSSTEIRLITPLARKAQKYRKANKPYNPILILTGNELFSQHEKPPYCWRKLGKKYDDYISGKKHFHDIEGLCYATQDIYLNFENESSNIKVIFNKGQTGKFIA